MSKTFVPMNKFGKDHWSIFAYIEIRIMDYNGEPDRSHMRTDKDRHPGLVGPAQRLLPVEDLSSKKYPTILKDNVKLTDHDDWDCLEDCEQAGLLESHGTGLYPIYKLTEEGRQVAGQLREHKSNGGNFSNFEVKGFRLEEF